MGAGIQPTMEFLNTEQVNFYYGTNMIRRHLNHKQKNNNYYKFTDKTDCDKRYLTNGTKKRKQNK